VRTPLFPYIQIAGLALLLALVVTMGSIRTGTSRASSASPGFACSASATSSGKGRGEGMTQTTGLEVRVLGGADVRALLPMAACID